MKKCIVCGFLYSVDSNQCSHCAAQDVVLEGFTAYAPALASGGGGFKSNYFSDLAEHESASFWFIARNKLIIWILKKYAVDTSHFLEIGCGTGYVLSGIQHAFPNANLYGSEIFVAGLAYAAQRLPKAKLMQMDARAIPFEHVFDTIGAFDVIEHIQEDNLVLEQMHAALKPGGHILITVPQHQKLWSYADDYACHVRRYSVQDLHIKIQSAGFDIVRSTSFVSLLLPAMWLSRFQSKSPADFDPTAELRIPKVLNLIMSTLMTIERYMIVLGFNLPIGGSRLVLARKKNV